jgi:hypothetical protein
MLVLVLIMVLSVVVQEGGFLKIDSMAATRSSAFSAPTIAKWKMGRGQNLTWDLDSWVKLGVRGNDLVFLEASRGSLEPHPPQPPPKEDDRVN